MHDRNFISITHTLPTVIKSVIMKYQNFSRCSHFKVNGFDPLIDR